MPGSLSPWHPMWSVLNEPSMTRPLLWRAFTPRILAPRAMHAIIATMMAMQGWVAGFYSQEAVAALARGAEHCMACPSLAPEGASHHRRRRKLRLHIYSKLEFPTVSG